MELTTNANAAGELLRALFFDQRGDQLGGHDTWKIHRDVNRAAHLDLDDRVMEWAAYTLGGYIMFVGEERSNPERVSIEFSSKYKSWHLVSDDASRRDRWELFA